MKSIYLFFCLFSLTLLSCYKTTKVYGHVYSKHKYPVAGAQISVIYLTSHGTEKMNTAVSESDGYYSFTFKNQSKYTYYMNCSSDSGKAANGIEIKYLKENNIDIYTTGYN